MTLKNFLGRLIFPKESKFNASFAEAIALATREIQDLSSSTKEFANLWIVAAPAKYFTEVFLENNDGWNNKFSKIFTGSKMIDASKCLMTTQAYLLSFDIYENYDRSSILNEINSKLQRGCEIVAEINKFTDIRNNSKLPEPLFMPYIINVLSTQYHDMTNEVYAQDFKQYFDPMSILGLSTYTTEFLRSAKERKSN